MKPTIKAIIFDCDGVLVDSVALQNKLFAKSLATHIPLESFISILTSKPGVKLDEILSIIEEETHYRFPKSFLEDFRKESLMVFRNELKSIKGIKSILSTLKLPFCVASNGPLNKIINNLETTDLLDFFKGNIFSGYELNSWKPSPNLLLEANKRNNVPPKFTLAIDDSLTGIQAAINGGFIPCAFLSTYTKDDFKSIDEGNIIYATDSVELQQIITDLSV